jgi:hypothetical protein
MKSIATGMLVGLALAWSVPATAKLGGGVTLTKDNWTKEAAFAPNLANPAFKAGDTLDATNFKALGDWIVPGVATLMEKHGLKLWTRTYKRIWPSAGFIEATNKYSRDVELIETGDNPRKKGIKNYTAGLPFPNPQTGLEVAWNYQYGYQGDDGGFHYGVYWISGKSGVERSEEWRWLYIIRAMHRTDLEPKPHLPALAAKDIQYTSMTWAIAPYDKAGFGALYSRYEEPKDQEGWIYIPTMRRTMKATFGTRGDAWNSTDMLYEDVRGFMGYPEWMNWKLIEKRTILAPMHAGVPQGKEALNQVFDFETAPHWNPKLKWEPRSVYVVEATAKFPDYPYAKMVFYFDAESNCIPIKEMYDKKGKLWKVQINAYNESPDMDKAPPGVGTSLMVDLQANHATAFPSYNFKANINLDPGKFSLSNLQKLGK